VESLYAAVDARFICQLHKTVTQDLQQVLESYDAAEESEEINLFGKVDEMGRNALLVASMLGKSSVVRELVKHGAKLDEQTVRGYTSLHLAACWGHLDTVQTLLELGADLKAKTFREETPLDLAKRYSQTDCVDHLTQAANPRPHNMLELPMVLWLSFSALKGPSLEVWPVCSYDPLQHWPPVLLRSKEFH
uniref:Uncharacterized protein n=1 Tax=Xiphophorus maculatus TaxID=8083 RepID=M4AVQ3_XIPMA